MEVKNSMIQTAYNGIYYLRSQSGSTSKPTYKHTDKSQFAYFIDSSVAYWMFGPEVEFSSGYIVAFDDTDNPGSVTSTWLTYDDPQARWLEDVNIDIRCINCPGELKGLLKFY